MSQSPRPTVKSSNLTRSRRSSNTITYLFERNKRIDQLIKELKKERSLLEKDLKLSNIEEIKLLDRRESLKKKLKKSNGDSRIIIQNKIDSIDERLEEMDDKLLKYTDKDRKLVKAVSSLSSSKKTLGGRRARRTKKIHLH